MNIVRHMVFAVLAEKYAVHALYGEEGLNQPSRFYIKIVVPVYVNVFAWLGSPACLQWSCDNQERVNKKLCVTAVCVGKLNQDNNLIVNITLKSKIALLQQAMQPRVFVNKSAKEVIMQVLHKSLLYNSRQIYFHCLQSFQPQPMLLQLFNETDHQFILRLCRDNQLFYWLQGEDVHFCDHALLCDKEGVTYQVNRNDGYIFRWSEDISQEHVFYQAQSYLSTLQVGNQIEIDGKDYLLQSIIHHVQASHRYSQQAMPYSNQLLLQETESAQVVNHFKSVQKPWCFVATIESTLPSPFLDESGRYRCRFDFIPERHAKGENSSPIIKGQFNAGMHFPCHDGEKVLITFANGDMQQPIILGALSQDLQPSMVTQKNPYQQVLQTPAYNGITVDRQTQEIACYTPDNRLLFACDDSHIISEKGGVALSAHHNIAVRVKDDQLVGVHGSWQITARHEIKLNQYQQAQYWQTVKTFSLYSGDDIAVNAQQNIFHFLDHAQVSTRQLHHFAQQGLQRWQIDELMRINTQNLHIQADNVIELQCGQSLIRLLPNAIEMVGQTVEFNFQQSHIHAKQCRFHDEKAPLFVATPFSSIADINQLARLKTHSQLLISDCRWSKIVAEINDTVNACAFVKNIEGDETVVLSILCGDDVIFKQHYALSEVSDSDDSCRQLRLPWQVSDSHLLQQHIHRNAVELLFTIDIEGCVSTRPNKGLRVVSDLLMKVSCQGVAPLTDQAFLCLYDPVGNVFRAIIKNGKAAIKSITLASITTSLLVKTEQENFSAVPVYTGQQWPQPHSQQHLLKDLKQQKWLLKTIMPMQVLRLSLEAVNPQRFNAFFDANKQQLFTMLSRHRPKNITLFIHGFHVAPGKCSHYIDRVYEVPYAKDGLTVDFSDMPATLYRTLHQLQQQFPEIADNPSFIDDFAINGSGDLSWLMAIEYYVNKACGLQNQGMDYYQRMIGVCWPAMADQVLDYMVVARRIVSVGKQLSVLLMLLLRDGFEVNVIAHSLGNGVLLQALNQLGKNPACQQKVNYCFLWEAAVPSNVFSSRGMHAAKDAVTMQLLMEQDEWYMPYAKQAAKHFVVLHSRNDNILGPIPDPQPCAKGQLYVNAQKPYYQELLPAVLLSFLGLESVYHVAMVLKLPIWLTIQHDSIDVFYQAWWQRYHPVRDHRQALFADTLDKRMRQVKAEDLNVTKRLLLSRYYQHRERIHQYLNAANRQASDVEYLEVNTLLFIFEHPSVDKTLADSLLQTLPVGEGLSFMMDIARSRLQDDQQQKFWVLLHSLFFDNDLQYPPALGYGGVDMADPDSQAMLASGQLTQVDQSEYLFSHSAMKDPSPEVFEQAYQQAIWQQQSDFHFGAY